VISYSLVEGYYHFRGTYCPHIQGERISQASREAADIMIKIMGFQDMMPFPLYQTTWHHIPEGHNFNIYCLENLSSLKYYGH
jgi:hypothetical protein